VSASPQTGIVRVDRLDLRVDATAWNFASERRGEINALFAELQRAQPALFNGRVLLMHRFTIEGRVLRGFFLEADYASFVAWQHWGREDAGIYDCFGAAAVETADGAFLLGVMGAHTYNAGQLYFPCGTPDPSDITDGAKVDFDFSTRRELHEETGLDPDALTAEPGWTLVFDGSLIAAIKVMRSPVAAEPLRAQILESLAREKQPELSDIRVVRGPADFDPMMRGFAKQFLTHRFAAS
jgi:8-oxo-dGTP pyrophosphatase MutT (NUDIX family)